MIGGGFQPEHFHFMLVETDDVAKLGDLMSPTLGRWISVVSPVDVQ